MTKSEGKLTNIIQATILTALKYVSKNIMNCRYNQPEKIHPEFFSDTIIITIVPDQIFYFIYKIYKPLIRSHVSCLYWLGSSVSLTGNSRSNICPWNAMLVEFKIASAYKTSVVENTPFNLPSILNVSTGLIAFSFPFFFCYHPLTHSYSWGKIKFPVIYKSWSLLLLYTTFRHKYLFIYMYINEFNCILKSILINALNSFTAFFLTSYHFNDISLLKRLIELFVLQ